LLEVRHLLHDTARRQGIRQAAPAAASGSGRCPANRMLVECDSRPSTISRINRRSRMPTAGDDPPKMDLARGFFIGHEKAADELRREGKCFFLMTCGCPVQASGRPRKSSGTFTFAIRVIANSFTDSAPRAEKVAQRQSAFVFRTPPVHSRDG